MDRDASALYLGRINAQISGLAAVSREAGQVERKIRSRLELTPLERLGKVSDADALAAS